MEDDNLLFFNGIDGESGAYDLPPMTGLELSSFIRGEQKPENLNELRWRYRQATVKTLGVKEGVDPLKLSEAGWGVIFPANADPAIQQALCELIDLRRQQAGAYFKLYAGPDGYRPDESKTDFLARFGAGPGPADPDKVPYYLLIVASPEEIPYQFQSQLDVQYAVGRIYFESLAEYASYAHTVAACEKGDVKLPRQAAFFGTANPDDRATQMSADLLVSPLHAAFQARLKDWQVDAYLHDQATKARLAHLLGGDQSPAVLFTASHGMSFPPGSPHQAPHQGALLCQDWPGPENPAGKGPISPSLYFSGDDVPADAGLLGMVAFFFACYGAGTPLNDEFSRQAFRQRSAIATRPFLARLPTRLLGHPAGGALAVIGHVERAWGYSFMWDKAGAQTTVFESSLERLFNGHPVGSAFEYFNERYAELSTVLTDALEDIDAGKRADPYQLAGLWTSNNDARDYTILGDPAVRLPLAQPGEKAARAAVIEITGLAQPTAPPVVALPETTAALIQPEIPPVAESAPAGLPQPGPVQATPGGNPVSAQPVVESMAINYGLMESLTDARDRLTTSLQSFADSLGKTLTRAVDDAATLQVSTSVSDDLAAARSDPARAELRAFTRIKIDGDTEVIVPQKGGEIDQALWAIHLSMVQQAQANRTEMIKAAAAAATGLLQALKVL